MNLQLDIQDKYFRMQSLMSIPLLDIQSVYGVECRAERRSHSSMFKIYFFECLVECRIYSLIFNLWMVLNAELKIDPTARHSR